MFVFDTCVLQENVCNISVFQVQEIEIETETEREGKRHLSIPGRAGRAAGVRHFPVLMLSIRVWGHGETKEVMPGRSGHQVVLHGSENSACGMRQGFKADHVRRRKEEL